MLIRLQRLVFHMDALGMDALGKTNHAVTRVARADTATLKAQTLAKLLPYGP